MPLHTEHLEVVVRSLHTALQSIEFESSSPALASWRSARMLIDLADDGGRTPSESAACLAVACDLLAFAEKSACGDESSSMLGVTLSSVVDLLGIHQLTEQVQGQEAEHAMSINGALLEFGVMEDQDACFMTGALRGIVARSTPVILWAAASLIVRKDALLRRWLEACQIPELSSTKTGKRPRLQSCLGLTKATLPRVSRGPGSVRSPSSRRSRDQAARSPPFSEVRGNDAPVRSRPLPMELGGFLSRL
ncbi:hypothetical protein OAN94_05895 [Verrucomicrobiales bacterium]|nr:hypothetical protein [Verrucomicrobiales bacterium]